MNDNLDEQCPVCLQTATLKSDWNADSVEILCDRCGSYRLSRTAQMSHLDWDNPTRSQVSARLRDSSDRGSPASLSSDSLLSLAENLPEYTVQDKMSLLVQALGRRSSFPGQQLEISALVDFPLCWALNSAELDFYLKSLSEELLIEIVNSSKDPESTVRLTTAGWSYLERLGAKGLEGQAFVAMAFAPELEPAWTDGIRPAVRQCGFHAYRVDKEPHAERIDARIIAKIKESRFLVADVTNQRQGVYFEAGYALGLGRPVLWTVRKEDLQHVHFDTRQYNHVVWETPEDLCTELMWRIRGVVGERPELAD